MGFAVPVPSLVKAMFIAGPFGCLLITAMIAAFVVLNSQKFRMRFVSLILTVTLLVWAGYITNAVIVTFNNQIA